VGNASRNETNEILTIYLWKMLGFIPRRWIRINWHSDQHNFGSWVGSKIFDRNIIRREVLNQYWLTIPKKRDNVFAGVPAFLTEMVKPKRGVFDSRLQSIKE